MQQHFTYRAYYSDANWTDYNCRYFVSYFAGKWSRLCSKRSICRLERFRTDNIVTCSLSCVCMISIENSSKLSYLFSVGKIIADAVWTCNVQWPWNYVGGCKGRWFFKTSAPQMGRYVFRMTLCPILSFCTCRLDWWSRIELTIRHQMYDSIVLFS